MSTAIDLSEMLAMCGRRRHLLPCQHHQGHTTRLPKGMRFILSQGTLPMIMGGDHSIGYPIAPRCRAVRGGKVGIIHLDRHVDTAGKGHGLRLCITCPWFHATGTIPNCPPSNLVQLGDWGWQVPRAGVKVGRDRGTTILTVNDIERDRDRQDD